jgi:eukaryotic-like serine/threonine-protein kinase
VTKKLSPGQRLGPFELENRIALGGMAEIWVAHEQRDDETRRVALKILQPFFGEDESFRAMFQDEIRIALRLRHENILEVYDAHEIDGFSLQSMELLDGFDVRRLLQRLAKAEQWFPVPMALYVGRCVARALAYAHMRRNEAGKPLEIVHRDISPHNVMITEAGGVKVLDFGIARAAERITRTKTGVVKGKISYMAPEQALAARVTPQTDIFATGILLWEMLAMRRLFSAANDADTLRKVVRAEVPPLLRMNPSVPKDAAKLIHQMLSASPEQRPESMQHVENALTKVLAIQYEEDESDHRALARWFRQFVQTRNDTPLGTPVVDGDVDPDTDITEVEKTKSLSSETTKPGDFAD